MKKKKKSFTVRSSTLEGHKNRLLRQGMVQKNRKSLFWHYAPLKKHGMLQEAVYKSGQIPKDKDRRKSTEQGRMLA